MQIKKLFTAFVLGLGLTLALVWFLGGGNVLPFARAASFTVDIFTDENDGSCTNGDCSLRDAIIIVDLEREDRSVSIQYPLEDEIEHRCEYTTSVAELSK